MVFGQNELNTTKIAMIQHHLRPQNGICMGGIFGLKFHLSYVSALNTPQRFFFEIPQCESSFQMAAICSKFKNTFSRPHHH